MGKPQFDPDAAFRNIVGVMEKTGQGDGGAGGGDAIDITGGHDGGETRSKRVNLVIKPSVHSRATAKCARMNISLNECINQFLEKWSAEGYAEGGAARQ